MILKRSFPLCAEMGTGGSNKCRGEPQTKALEKNGTGIAHRSGEFDHSDFLWHLLAFETLGPLHHSSLSPGFRSRSPSRSLARSRGGSHGYDLLRDLIGLDLSGRPDYVLHGTVPSLLQLLLLILWRRLPLLVWTGPGGWLLLAAAFHHLQAGLDIGTWCGDLRAAIGRDGGGLIGIL